MGFFNNRKQDRLEIKTAIGVLTLVGTPANIMAVALGSLPVAIGVGAGVGVVFLVVEIGRKLTTANADNDET